MGCPTSCSKRWPRRAPSWRRGSARFRTAVEHQRTGWLVSAGDPAALAAAIRALGADADLPRAARTGGARTRRAGFRPAALHRAAAARPRGGLCLSADRLGALDRSATCSRDSRACPSCSSRARFAGSSDSASPLRVYVIKRSDESIRHAIVDEIEARPEYLPAAGSVSAIPLWRWLARHSGAFAPSVGSPAEAPAAAA